jgi:hypothetical protein
MEPAAPKRPSEAPFWAKAGLPTATRGARVALCRRGSSRRTPPTPPNCFGGIWYAEKSRRFAPGCTKSGPTSPSHGVFAAPLT